MSLCLSNSVILIAHIICKIQNRRTNTDAHTKSGEAGEVAGSGSGAGLGTDADEDKDIGAATGAETRAEAVSM